MSWQARLPAIPLHLLSAVSYLKSNLSHCAICAIERAVRGLNSFCVELDDDGLVGPRHAAHLPRRRLRIVELRC